MHLLPLAYQASALTRCATSQRMRHESNLRPGSGRVPSPVGLSIQVRSGWDSHPQGGLHRSPVFGTGAVGLSASRSNAESERFELRGARHALHRFQRCPSCHPDNLHVRGRRADRTPAGLPPRPPVSNRVPYQLGQPSVRREGLAPSRPFRDTDFWGPRVCIPPPALGVAGEI